MKIHPTAIIDPKAELHESVEVGPFCVIDKDVKIGEGTVLDSNVRIYSGTHIGKFNKIYSGVALGGIPQDLGFKPETKTYLEIGDRNTIRENCVFHRGTKEGEATKIGNDNFLMGNIHIAHDVIVGDNNIIVQSSMLAGHVVVGNKVFISGLVGVHQFARVGDYSMIAGLAKVVKDVPPYCTIDGNPATVIGLNSVGLKRAGLSSDVRNAIKRTYKIIYHSGLNTKQALTELKKDPNPIPEVKYIIEFFESGKRGVTDHRAIGGGGSEE
ncbi:acyl-[acyl-carrier-protein]--UDP-N-acetylglucosamine O-acyltransferase [Leptospira kobayashii]|uniref:Acyl-[acyl-carrier-protein]--UDP-N-acetylglucosamine O-acyltransferase n=1 Tax=Leptospira kobayashii TaxID=1917830 RepID=A0ABM7UML6_9LEPT|nr:acyl-ACP--UDP-N-acetylglucosamine O-acyltransferase [Leptospira kobayashii]BDA80329.1 acyl-[acyl-carrier-protein]--UDP-N-acetylglucosamine O-acyltransferase [Leptospira kobayashii]